MGDVHVIYLVAALHGVLLASALLLTPHKNRGANAVLACLVSLITLPLWNLYARNGAWQDWVVPGYLMWASLFLWGPALHCYIGIVSGQRPFGSWTIPSKTGRNDNASQPPAPPHVGKIHVRLRFVLYVLPAIFIGAFVYFSEAYELVPPDQMLVMRLCRLMAFYLHMAICFYACFQLLRHYDIKIQDNYSHIDHLNLSWLSWLTRLFALAIFVDMVFTIPALINGQSSPYLILYMLVEAVTVFAIGYLAMLKSAVRYGQLLDEEVADTTRSPLDDALVASLTAKLNAVMQDAQAYKKNDLRLSELAEMTDVSKEILSKYINQHCHKNFYEYVNEYRVRAAAALLAVDEKANIEKVAFDAGFNNRVSFHHAFKKLTGKTPSQYRRGERAKGCTVSKTHGQPARAT